LSAAGTRADHGQKKKPGHDEAHKLFDEVANMLTEMRRKILGSDRPR
jgi:hypothetical protein